MITIYRILNLFDPNNQLAQVNSGSRKYKHFFRKILKIDFSDNHNFGKAIYRKKNALKRLYLTVGSFTIIFLLGFSTDFFKPMHEREIELLCEFPGYDVSPCFDLMRNKEESKIKKYFSNGEYELVIEYGLKNFDLLSYPDIILLGTSYQKLGRIDIAINVYEMLSGTKSNRFMEFVEYKLAYLYLANCDARGLELLGRIMGNDEHIYSDLAFRLYNLNPAILMTKELKKNNLLELFSID